MDIKVSRSPYSQMDAYERDPIKEAEEAHNPVQEPAENRDIYDLDLVLAPQTETLSQKEGTMATWHPNCSVTCTTTGCQTTCKCK